MRRPPAILLLPLALLVLVLNPTQASGELPRLVGTVGPGFTIDLADASGKHVDVVTAGRYELLVHDLSEMHNFVLGSKATGERLADSGVEFVGDKTFEIELVPGAYAYACSPHFQIMNGHLTVVPATPPVATKPKPLSARVGTGAVTVSATRLSPGGYVLTIVDRSRSRNFHLVGPGIDRRTGKTFVGTVKWTLKLARGTYRFGSDPKLAGRLVVA